MKLIIKSVKNKPFTRDDGSTTDYFWYRAVRLADGVTFQFGSMTGGHELEKELDLNIEKTEKISGGFGYKEVKG